MIHVYYFTAAFTMEGKRKLFQDEEHIPSILFREENNVKHYVSLKKSSSKNSYKLTMTKVSKHSSWLLIASSLQLYYHSRDLPLSMF